MAQKKLVLAEKPPVGRDIARVLQCKERCNGGLEGRDYVVTWALGHLVTLSDPEEYDKRYKEWNLEDLPMIPKEFKLEVIKQSSKQYHAVKALLHRNDIGEIIIATDAGREGELVARWILEKAGNRKPIHRLWISSVTDKAIKEGFAKLRTGAEYENLYRAAVSRAKADWLVGMNATRALTCKYNASLSCGRVQTPTLQMIAKREEEIRNFKPEPFYGIQANVSFASGKDIVTCTWVDEKSKTERTFDKAYRDEIYAKCMEAPATVTSVQKTTKKSYAPQLYDLAQLQRDANQLFGYSAKQTLTYMQRLYENHKVVTYPRTDSKYLSSDIVPTLKERVKACSIAPYREFTMPLLKQTITGNPSFVDNSKVSDHHAIIPTEQCAILQNMTNEERKIYDLIVRRFLAVLYPPCEYEQTTVTINVLEEQFIAKGKRIVTLGYQVLHGSKKEASLPDISKGQPIKEIAFKKTEGKTQPKGLFTEATLLAAMENPVDYLESKEKGDIQILGQTGGLGTVATRADIIEKLFATNLIEKKGKEIVITGKAKQLLSFVPAELKKPELTADWERKLSLIASGRLPYTQFLEDITAYTKEVTQQIKQGEGNFKHDNLTNHRCPTCGKQLLLVKGKNSTRRVCQDRTCNYSETISRTSNARCPQCHKRMELIGQGDKQQFACGCGYKEKLDNFKERRKKEGAGVSKREVAKYLNQAKKEDAPLNNAFADAFSRLNLK